MLVDAVDIVAYPKFRKECRSVISMPANLARLWQTLPEKPDV